MERENYNIKMDFSDVYNNLANIWGQIEKTAQEALIPITQQFVDVSNSINSLIPPNLVMKIQDTINGTIKTIAKDFSVITPQIASLQYSKSNNNKNDNKIKQTCKWIFCLIDTLLSILSLLQGFISIQQSHEEIEEAKNKIEEYESIQAKLDELLDETYYALRDEIEE